MKYLVIRCWCHKGESLSTSINNRRNQQIAGTLDSAEEAEEYKKGLQDREVARIKREQKSKEWTGNEFVFWVEPEEVGLDG